MKIYNTWNKFFTIMGLISAFYVSFYVYYGACNISNYFCSKKLPSRSNYSIVLGIFCGYMSYLVIYWSKFSKNESVFNMYSQLSSVYVLFILVFILINLVRQRDLTYGIILLIIMA